MTSRRRTRPATAGSVPASERRRLPGAGSAFWPALLSGMAMWAALPPLGWWPLGWVAPVGWLLLIRAERLPGGRPYWAIYFASVLYWALVMQGIRLAHWANYLGLVALAFYLGIYVPLFVAAARVLLHRWRWPLLVVAPVAWVGVEVARGYGPLAFSMALLAHTQVKQLALIQAADLLGPYTVSAAIMLVAACLTHLLPAGGILPNARLVPGAKVRLGWQPAIVLLLTLSLLWGYGQFRLGQQRPGQQQAPLRVALIQGSIDTVFDDDPERPLETLEQYTDLTTEACQRYGPLDLVMWPETMFPIREIRIDGTAAPQLDPSWDPSLISDTQRAFEQLVANQLWRIHDPQLADAELGESTTPKQRATSWVFGASTWQLGDYPSRRYNAALLASPQAQLVGRYYKMRPVIFGEYVPFGDVIPALYHLFPLPNGLSRGPGPAAWKVGPLTLSPSICFESTMPQLLRSHVAQLTQRGEAPDVLINLTNDGWFWGSSILDMHLNCAIFRSVELRRPFLVAANTGFSAWIDGNGRVLVQGPRRATGIVIADVVPDGRRGWYEVWGDGPVLVCTLLCLLALAAEGRRRVVARRNRDSEPAPTD